MRRADLILLLLCALCACSSSVDDGARDMTMPVIISDGILPVPDDCELFFLGDTIHFHYIFEDDTELGAFNIEIHNNFDHHSHSTSASECIMDPKKKPVKPWVFNKDYTIPDGLRTYDASVDILIPADVDPGDYHFMIRLTDKAGWQQLKAASVKIINNTMAN